jgi:hypothetical protein
VKTKKIGGVDCAERCFAWVGDENDTSTWKLPIHIPGNAAQTVNMVKDALGRFAQTQGIPDDEKSAVWHTIRGAGLALGLKVPDHAKKPKAPPMRPVEVKRDADTERLLAMADAKATAFLKSLGLE